MGPPTEWKEIAKNTLIQSSASPKDLPLILAAINTVRYTAFGLSVLGMGWITDRFSVQYTYLIAAGLTLLSAWVAIRIKHQHDQSLKADTLS